MQLALALEGRLEDRLMAELRAVGHEVVGRAQTAGELATMIERYRPQVALVSATRSRLTAALIEACDAALVRLVALASGELERRHAAGLGLYEVLDADAPWLEVEEFLGAAPLARYPRVEQRQSRRPATVVAVWGPTGAPGRSTLAINLAAELAADDRTVVLADVDVYGGAVAPALGLLDEAPGFAAACRLAGAGRLDRSELERVAQRYESRGASFWVLTGIARASRWPELTNDRVTKTVEACRDWADFVVIDVGFSIESDEEISSDLFAPRRNAATIAVLRAADRIVAIGLPDPVGLSRFLRAHTELVELGFERISVVMNRVRASAIGVNPAGQLVSTLARFGGLEPDVLLPDDGVALDTAVLTARTLRDAAPKSPVRIGIQRFAEESFAPPRSESRRARRDRRRS